MDEGKECQRSFGAATTRVVICAVNIEIRLPYHIEVVLSAGNVVAGLVADDAAGQL